MFRWSLTLCCFKTCNSYCSGSTNIQACTPGICCQFWLFCALIWWWYRKQCLAIYLKEWKVIKVHKYSCCKKGTYKIIFLLDVFPVKIVCEDTSLLGCFALSTGKCNHQPDEGDTALLWNLRDYHLTWYYIPGDWNPYQHDYEICISWKLVLAQICVS